MHRRSRVWLGVLLIASAQPFVGNAQSALPHVIPPVRREPLEDWPQAGVDVTVLDAQDAPVPILTAQQVDVREDNKAVAKFDLVPSGDEPQSVCILVDTSGSTFTHRDVIRRSMQRLISDLPPQDEMCLIDFASDAFVDSDLTTDRNKLRAGMDYLKISGGSAVRDSLVAAVKYLMENARYRSRTIVLLSDGADNASNGPRGQLSETLHRLGAPVVYVIDNHVDSGHGPADREDRHWIESVARETGGQAWFPTGNAEVDATVANLVQTLGRRYRLILTTASARDGRMHRLDVTLNKDLRKQKTIVNATRGFYAALP